MKTLRMVLVAVVALAAGMVGSADAQTVVHGLDNRLAAQSGVYFDQSLAAGVVASPDAETLLFTLDTPNPQPGANFGERLTAAGDVNGDGKADVTVGAPGEDVGGNAGQGRAYVFLGPGGLLDRHLDTPNPQVGANFGVSVAVGDVDGDGKADIAVGAPGEDGGAGRAYVFSGADGSLMYTLDSPNPQAYARFGESLAVGDVSGDGKADIAVGAPGEDVGGNANQGRAYVFSGADGWPLFTLDTPNPQLGAHFGWSVAVGDVNADGNADIAVGAPGEDVGDNFVQGRVYVFSGASGAQLAFSPLDTPNPQPGAFFGWSLAVGEVNADGNADIAVGAWLELVGPNAGQGRAYVFSGAHGGLLFTLDTPNPQGDALFGWSVSVGDVNGDHKGDIAVGARGEDVDLNENQGRAYVFSGADGLLLSTLDSPNPQAYAFFGQSVAAGDVDGNGGADVAVGAPLEDVDGNGNQGRAYVFSLGCHARVHTDGDGFDDRVECYLGTDPTDACPDDPWDDAWPLDMDNDTNILIWDVFAYRGAIGLLYRDPEWSPAIQRLDLNADGAISGVADMHRFYYGLIAALPPAGCDGGTSQPPSWTQGTLVTMGIDPYIDGNTASTLGDLEACVRVNVDPGDLGDDQWDHQIDVYVTGDPDPPAPTGYDAWVIYDGDMVDPVSWDDRIKLGGATPFTNKMGDRNRLNAAATYSDSGQGTAGEGTIVRIDLAVKSPGNACFVFGHAVAYASEQLHPTTARVAMLAINQDCPTEDWDGDGVFDVCDNCPEDYNPSQRDFDGDGHADACDNCPADYNPGQEDFDSDGWGDTCEGCPTTATPWYTPPADEDCDGFSTPDEEDIGTDPLDNCSQTSAPDDEDPDAWPLDMDDDQDADVFDVMKYIGYVGVIPPVYSQRLDLDVDGDVDIFDVMKFVGIVATPHDTCT